MTQAVNRRQFIAGALSVAALAAAPGAYAQANALVDGLLTGATPCGAPPLAGMKVAGRDPMPQGIIVTPDRVIFDTFRGDFADAEGWDFGDRQILIRSRFGAFNNWRSRNQRAKLIGKSGSNPGVWIQHGAGFDISEFVTVENSRASMILKEEKGGFATVIRRWHTFGQSQDVFKVSGGNRITENRIGKGVKRTTGPHSDVGTVIDGNGGVVFDNNHVEHGYEGADQSGTNDLFRFEAYWTGAIYDDIDIHDNFLRHMNARSFAIHVTSKNSPVWRGSIKISNNRIDKAGGWGKILYAPSSRISLWQNNVDAKTGQVIPLSAT